MEIADKQSLTRQQRRTDSALRNGTMSSNDVTMSKEIYRRLSTVRDRNTTLIDHKLLESGHAFSFTDQPYLKQLFKDVQDLAKPLTIVVGAGVSMNAGLRSWRQLIDDMVPLIKDERLRHMAKLDTSDPMRKAELILQLIKKDLSNVEDPTVQDAKIIKSALYPQGAKGTPGPLAQSIARLVVTRQRNVQLITTNFDVVLEKALEAYFDKKQVKSFSLDELKDWKEWTDKGRIGVLHVHGVIPWRIVPTRLKGPIVLAESQFFKNGAKVRDTISRLLEGGHSLFVGLSMTDPNLVGPVYQTRNEIDQRRYALAVPDETAGAKDSLEAARYAIEAAEFMERELRLSTIFMKSYSQLNQVLSDLSLAIVEPDKYQPEESGPRSLLVYGNRLKKALNSSYVKIGCRNPDQQIPLAHDGEELHNKLYGALHSSDGPVTVLRALTKDIGDYRIGEPDGENFALFLWLRCRPTRAPKASYALNLVATSAYIHREAWSIKWWEQPIMRESQVVAVNAIFMGTKMITNLATNLDTVPGTRIWRGIMACPIVMTGTSSSKRVNGVPLDTVTIGTITLNSTHYVNKYDPNLPRNGKNRHHENSAIIALDAGQTDLLFESVTLAAAKLFTD